MQRRGPGDPGIAASPESAVKEDDDHAGAHYTPCEPEDAEPDDGIGDGQRDPDVVTSAAFERWPHHPRRSGPNRSLSSALVTASGGGALSASVGGVTRTRIPLTGSRSDCHTALATRSTASSRGNVGVEAAGRAHVHHDL